MKGNRQKLRIGELASAAGVSVPTVKFYLQQGLLPRPEKTGRTMSYYDPSCVARIRLVRRLQREKYLPLAVIRRVIASGRHYREELEFGRAVFRSGKFPAQKKSLDRGELSKFTGYPSTKVDALERERLLMPVTENGRKRYDTMDVAVIKLFQSRERLGLPMDYSLRTVLAYRDAIGEAVRKDMRLFARIMLGEISTGLAVEYMTEADETLDQFMVLYRTKLLRSLSAEALEQVSAFSHRLRGICRFPLKPRSLAEMAGRGQPWDLMAMLFRGRFEKFIQSAHHRPGSSREFRKLFHGLAWFLEVNGEPGFSQTASLLRKGLSQFQSITAQTPGTGIQILTSYFCAAVYAILPDIFGTRDKGMAILQDVQMSLSMPGFASGLPVWAAPIFAIEIFPAMEVKLAGLFSAAKHSRRKEAR